MKRVTGLMILLVSYGTSASLGRQDPPSASAPATREVPLIYTTRPALDRPPPPYSITPTGILRPPPSSQRAVAVRGTKWECPDTDFDFGVIWQNANVTRYFEIRNISREVLEIRDVKADCHCTVPGQFERRIAPGATGRVPFTFQSAGLGGSITKGATITLSDPQKPTLRVTLKGEIKTLFTMTPNSGGNFGEITDPNAEITHVMDVVSNVDEPVTLTPVGVVTTQPFNMKVKEVEPGKKWKLILKTVPPLPAGTLARNFIFSTGHPKIPTWNVRASCYRPARIATKPVALRLPDVVNSEGQPFTVTVFNHGKTPVKVLSAAVEGEPSLRTEITEDPSRPENQGRYKVTVRAPKGFRLGESRDLVIKTDDAELPTIRTKLYTVKPQGLPPVAGAARPPGAAAPGQDRRNAVPGAQSPVAGRKPVPPARAAAPGGRAQAPAAPATRRVITPEMQQRLLEAVAARNARAATQPGVKRTVVFPHGGQPTVTSRPSGDKKP